MSAENIVRALESGLMRQQGLALNLEQKRLVAEFLAGRKIGEATKTGTTGLCPAGGAAFAPGGSAWNGWSIDTSNARFQPAQTAGLAAAEVPRLRVKWAFAFPDTFIANAQPSITGGRIFVASANRHVYSLDARSGCQYWSFEAEAPIRTAITVFSLSGDRPRHVAIFGDQRANAYAVDASNGELLWKVHADDHPRAKMVGSPTYYDGRVFVPVTAGEEGAAIDPKYECCTARGSLLVLDAATGRRIWKTYTVSETPKIVGRNKQGTAIYGPSGASIWSAPTVDPDKKRLYASTGDNFSGPTTSNSDAVVAFDMQTGWIVWSKQLTVGDAWNNACISVTRENCPDDNGPDADIASSPILIRTAAGKRLLLVGQKSGVFHAIDPDRNGEVVWQTRVGKGGVIGGIMFGSATDGRRAFVAVTDTQFADPATAKGERWDRTVGGGVTAVNVDTGKILWAAPPGVCEAGRPNCTPGHNAAVTAIPGAVFAGALDSHLRAYAAEDGNVLWDFDTYKSFQTVNGLSARGGPLRGGGAAVVDGVVYAGAGSLLLAFSVDGR
jgi:polyvinyl alcohol dehydrogenase (cytochrome)